MRAWSLAMGLAFIGLPVATALHAAGTDDSIAADRAAITAFQDKDQRLQDVGWRLVAGNAAYCSETIPAIGLQLQDLQTYGNPEAARAALAFESDFAVETAAKGSPADRAGVFHRNREIIAIDGQNPTQWPSERKRRWERLTRAHDWIDQRLKSGDSVTVTFADGVKHTLTPVHACATRFELLGDSKRAVADGARVIIGTDFPAFEWDDEAAFAGVVAHELAHNLLGHRKWLDRNKRKGRHVRLTEREADRLMPWLLANAGYDPQAAVAFMERWGKNHSKGIFRNLAYEGWDERAEHIAAEVPIVQAAMARDGVADWATQFRREIDPDLGL